MKLAAITAALLLAASPSQTQEGRGEVSAAQGSSQAADASPDMQALSPLSLPVRIIEEPDQTEEEKLEAQARERREEEDLVAQKGMNSATQSIERYTRWMTITAIGSFFTSIVGGVLLFWTLWVSRDAVRATRQVGRDQTRAYLSVPEAQIVYTPPNFMFEEGTFDLQIVIRNTGATPARWHQVEAGLMFLPEQAPDGSGQAVVGKNLDLEAALDAQSFPRYGAVPNGLSLERSVDSLERLQDFLRRAMSLPDTNRIVNAGRIRYETVFGEIFTVRFEFIVDPYEVMKLEGGSKEGVVRMSPLPVADDDSYQNYTQA